VAWDEGGGTKLAWMGGLLSLSRPDSLRPLAWNGELTESSLPVSSSSALSGRVIRRRKAAIAPGLSLVLVEAALRAGRARVAAAIGASGTGRAIRVARGTYSIIAGLASGASAIVGENVTIIISRLSLASRGRVEARGAAAYVFGSSAYMHGVRARFGRVLPSLQVWHGPVRAFRRRRVRLPVPVVAVFTQRPYVLRQLLIIKRRVQWLLQPRRWRWP